MKKYEWKPLLQEPHSVKRAREFLMNQVKKGWGWTKSFGRFTKRHPWGMGFLASIVAVFVLPEILVGWLILFWIIVVMCAAFDASDYPCEPPKRKYNYYYHGVSCECPGCVNR